MPPTLDKPLQLAPPTNLQAGHLSENNDKIKNAVGRGAKNDFQDVELVQKLLLQAGAPNIKVTGLMDDATQNAILNFKLGYIQNSSNPYIVEASELATLQNLTSKSLSKSLPHVMEELEAKNLIQFLAITSLYSLTNEPIPNDFVVYPASYKGQDSRWTTKDFSNEAHRFTIAYPTFKDLAVSSGQELLNKFEEATKNNQTIRHLVFFGHADSEGFHFDSNAGLYAEDKNKNQKNAANTALLEQKIKEGAIKFDNDGVIIFLHACNSFLHAPFLGGEFEIKGDEISLAKSMAKATQRPVIGAIGATGSSDNNITFGAEDEKMLRKNFPEADNEHIVRKASILGYYIIIPDGETVYYERLGTSISFHEALTYLSKKQATMKKANNVGNADEYWLKDMLKNTTSTQDVLKPSSKPIQPIIKVINE